MTSSSNLDRANLFLYEITAIILGIVFILCLKYLSLLVMLEYLEPEIFHRISFSNCRLIGNHRSRNVNHRVHDFDVF